MRNIALIVFLIILSLALSLYFRQGVRPPVENLSSSSDHNAYLTINNFKFSKFKTGQVQVELEGVKASLTRIDFVEFFQRTKGWRRTQRGKEKFEANYVYALLSSNRLDDFHKAVKVLDALFKEDVSLFYEDLAIYTQEAHYLGSEKNIIVGDMPVRAISEKQQIESEKGIRLDLKNEEVSLFGKIKGVVNLHEKK